MKVSAFCTALLFAGARIASSQSFPGWALEVAVGQGQHDTHSGETYYNSDHSDVLRYALAYRLTEHRSSAWFLKADYAFSANGDQIAICAPAPNGTCRKYFEDTNGIGVGVGVRRRVSEQAALGLYGGGGYYGTHFRPFTEADMTLRFAEHVGLIGAARYMRWSDGAPHWFAPLTVGVQVF